MNFEFATATRIIFGPGAINGIAQAAGCKGKKVLLTSGATEEIQGKLVELLHTAECQVTIYPVTQEPELKGISTGVDLAREAGCELVIGLGGGSALDTGKAIAALAGNPGDVLDYLEVVGRGQPLKTHGLPFVAVPTTAGTGSEVTSNAVLSVPLPSLPDTHVKVSLRSPMMLARLAIVDPELTYQLPQNITASTGMDALTQVIEPYVSNKANPLTDALCLEGIRRAARSLRQVCEPGIFEDARQDMAVVSLFGGLALANAKLGAVHGFAGVIGGRYSAPHGVICARLLSVCTKKNVHALQSRQPGHTALQRYADIARLVTNNPVASLDDLVEWLETLVEDLAIPRFTQLGMRLDELDEVADQSAKSSSMQGNPIKLEPSELREILLQTL